MVKSKHLPASTSTSSLIIICIYSLILLITIISIISASPIDMDLEDINCRAKHGSWKKDLSHPRIRRDDDDSFWEMAQSFGRNRWTAFTDGFTELGGLMRAAGRGLTGGITNMFNPED